MITKYSLKVTRQMEFAQVMANVKRFLEKEDLEDLALSAIKTEFDAAFSELEVAIKATRKSQHTQKLNKLAQQRDSLLMSYFSHCKVYKNFPVEHKAQAAQRLLLLNEKYSKEPKRTSSREKTALVRVLISELATPEMSTALTTIGASEWIDQLKKINNDFDMLHSDRTQEQGAIETGWAKTARTKMQEVFTRLTQRINGFIIVGDEEKYKKLSNSINEEVKRVTQTRNTNTIKEEEEV